MMMSHTPHPKKMTIEKTGRKLRWSCSVRSETVKAMLLKGVMIKGGSAERRGERERVFEGTPLLPSQKKKKKGGEGENSYYQLAIDLV